MIPDSFIRRLRDVPPPFIAILVISAVLLLIVTLREQLQERPMVAMTEIRAGSPVVLEKLFAEYGFQWPPDGTAPSLALEQMPPGMHELPVSRKKKLFFRAVLPLILAENQRIELQREFVQQAGDFASLNDRDRTRLRRIAGEYRVTGDLSDPEVFEILLRRVDTVPPALALAQAANESAWGTSRFVLEANNLFGIWTWDESMGVLPQRREAGKTHLVRVYPDLRAAVRAYLFTLNTGHAYVPFRQQRRAMRERGEPLDALVLAGHLERYSERGSAYVAEIRSMIRSNELTLANHLRLAG